MDVDSTDLDTDLRLQTVGHSQTKRRYLLLLTFVAALVTLGVWWTNTSRKESNAFFFIQLSDPQLGLEHSNADWQRELAMLSRSVRIINRLSPRFVVLTGDMQNYLPTNLGTAWPMPRLPGNVGSDQARQVQQALSLLANAIPLRAVVPGNHDLGYAPTNATVNAYRARWGDDSSSFDESGVRFVAFDSQVYYNSSQPGMQVHAEAQTAWLKSRLDAAAGDGVHATVLLTHIPPFLVDALEESGWANWPLPLRQRFLELTQTSRVPPSLVINGHVHANVLSERTSAFGAPLQVVTTSSVGCPIMWNGSAETTLSLRLARAVAAEPTGHDAFVNYVLRDDARGPKEPARIAHRVAARPDRSGVRLFEFDPAAGYRHQWLTLDQLAKLAAPLVSGRASPLAHRPFTPWR